MKLRRRFYMTAHRAKNGLARNSPTILTVIASAGVIFTVIAAIKATPKAEELIALAEQDHELTKGEKVIAALPAYIPTIGLATGTIFCIFGANAINRRQQANLISAYAMLDQAYKKYQNKVLDLYGTEREKEIRDLIDIDDSKSETPPESDTDLPLFYLPSYGYFNSAMEDVVRAEYDINHNLTLRGYVSLNELYAFLDLEERGDCDKRGWSAWIMNEEWEAPWITFEHQLIKTDDGLEYYVIHMLEPPELDETLYPGCRAMIDADYPRD